LLTASAATFTVSLI